MVIANPIYDAVFKRLMENEKVMKDAGLFILENPSGFLIFTQNK